MNPRYGQQPRGRTDGPPRDDGQQKQLPQPRRVQYYKPGSTADQPVLDETLVDEKADQVARSIQRMASAQLRRFYDEVINLRRRIELEAGEGGKGSREKAFELLRADFKMLKAKAAYAHFRPQGKVPEEFLQFIVDNCASVQTVRDFDAFHQYFQAVVAFHKVYGRG